VSPAALGAAILEAKLHPPRLHAEHVPRPRLVEFLEAVRPLTLLDAPTGFGKSTLLAAWCAEGAVGRSVAWLSLDEGDNDPALFWSYVLHALRRVTPGYFGEVLALLDQPGVSLARVFLPAVLNELWMLDQPLVLVLDDYHLIREAACHESLRFFCGDCPQRCAW
jgi:LuxR family maltose regulon positive regulatory protein